MNTQFTILPNPFLSTLSLEVIVEHNASAIVQMLDKQLKIIRMLSWNLKKGTNKTTIDDLDHIPAGDYYIEIKSMDGKNLYTTKLVKVDENEK